MSTFGDTLMTPRIDAKIRSSMYKHRKSNFKDLLRERFRNQIRANRRTLFEKMRSFDSSDEVQNSLNSILRSEIQQFDVADQKKRTEHPLRSQSKPESEMDPDELVELIEEIKAELINEQYEWILEEYRREEERIISFYEEEPVVCPICLRGALKKCSFVDPISCTNCDLRLCSSSSLETFSNALRLEVDEHSKSCISVPQFSILNEGFSKTLVMYCDRCNLLRSLN